MSDAVRIGLVATSDRASQGVYRDEGIPALEQWLAGLGHRLRDFDESTFYSDSHNDLPLLERVTRPVAVDPDEALAAEAARRRWPMLSLRR